MAHDEEATGSEDCVKSGHQGEVLIVYENSRVGINENVVEAIVQIAGGSRQLPSRIMMKRQYGSGYCGCGECRDQHTQPRTTSTDCLAWAQAKAGWLGRLKERLVGLGSARRPAGGGQQATARA